MATGREDGVATVLKLNEQLKDCVPHRHLCHEIMLEAIQCVSALVSRKRGHIEWLALGAIDSYVGRPPLERCVFSVMIFDAFAC